MNLVKVLESAAKAHLDKIAIIEKEDRVTYRQLWDRVDRLAKAFLDIGIKEGDSIAICLPNCQEYIYAFFASLKINVIVVPLKQAMTSYELKKLLKDCQPSLFITDNIFLKSMLPFDPIIEAGKLVICSKHFLKRGLSKRAIKIDDLFKSASGLGTTFSADNDSVASINYTYRGYGYPLGAMLTHGNYINGLEVYLCTTGISSKHNILLNLPISHIYPLIGCVIAPLFIGSSIVFADKCNPKEIFELIDSFKIDVITSVPTFYRLLSNGIKKNKNNFYFVKHAFSGGSPLPISVYQNLRDKLGWNIRQGYGLSECLPVTCNPVNNNRPDSVGKVGFGAKVQVVNEKNEQLKANKIGEIIVGGNSVMIGYFRRPKETEKVLNDCWCLSGDYGYFDQEGYLYFTGFKKYIAKVGGNMVDLKEVENTIKLFPDVVNSKVNTIDDEIWGQLLTAEVFVKKIDKFDTKKLRRFLRDRLSSYKMPKFKIVG